MWDHAAHTISLQGLSGNSGAKPETKVQLRLMSKVAVHVLLRLLHENYLPGQHV